MSITWTAERPSKPAWDFSVHIWKFTFLSKIGWRANFGKEGLRGLKTSPYVALPDAFLKYANWGNISNIPSIYQPYYAPKGTKTNWSVTISSINGTRNIANVLVTDVGPWNEDDNWWDANGTSATLPSSCPVSSTLIAPDATSNPLVNGICPNGQNLRRIYYYLLRLLLHNRVLVCLNR